MDPVGPGDPFGPYLLADCVRLLLAAAGLFLVMLTVRVAWLRFTSPEGDPLRDRSPMALLSYGAFAILPTGNAMQFIGHEPDWGLLTWFAVACGTGLWAVFGQVTIRRLWTRGDTTTEAGVGRHRDR